MCSHKRENLVLKTGGRVCAITKSHGHFDFEELSMNNAKQCLIYVSFNVLELRIRTEAKKLVGASVIQTVVLISLFYSFISRYAC